MAKSNQINATGPWHYVNIYTGPADRLQGLFASVGSSAPSCADDAAEFKHGDRVRYIAASADIGEPCGTVITLDTEISTADKRYYWVEFDTPISGKWGRWRCHEWNLELIEAAMREPPRNNDGRKHCHWCGAPTRRVLGLNAAYDVCSDRECGK